MKHNILVIGDSILDHDIFCDSIGLSLETPTLKTRFCHESFLFGGAANVVENILSLNNPVTFITFIADDEYRKNYNDWENKYLKFRPIHYSGENLVKSRFWIKRGSNTYKFLQVNRGTEPNNKSLLDVVKETIQKADFKKAILVDYNNGMFRREKDVKSLIKILKDNNIEVISSSQKSDRESKYSLFRGSDLICMNMEEAQSSLQNFETNYEKISLLSDKLQSNLCITNGSNGSFFYHGDALKEIPSFKVNCIDPCGAGDAYLAALSVTGDPYYASKWAAISVTKIGTQVPTLEEFNDFQ